MRQLFAFSLLIFISAQCFAFPKIDTIINPQINTIQIYKQGWELSLPILELGSTDKLVISFDDLSAQPANYWYKIVHCNSAWQPDELDYTDYIDGFWHNPVRNAMPSTNTTVPYIHYSFELPNEEIAIKISGNYLLLVFENDDESNIAFIKKFYITEQQVNSKFSVSRPQLPRYMQRYQQFWLEIQPMLPEIIDLKEEIQVQVYQNFDPESKKIARVSYLHNNNTLVYNDPDSNLFFANNEFRNFDIKSVKYQSPRIRAINFNNNFYNITLHDDEPRNKKLYFTEEDINGKFFIENSTGRNKHRDADYFWVSFTLLAPFYSDGDVYIAGECTNWKRDQNSRMKYNFRTKAYEHKLLLKQGYYNYMYVFKSNFTGLEEPGFIEGLHYETDNDYIAMVYYKGFSARYERLIGVTYANSINKSNEKKYK